MKKQLLLGAFLLGSFFTANAQDTCATALTLDAGVTTVGEIDGEYLAAASGGCWQSGATTPAAEWYVFTSAIDGSYRINTDLAANDPALVDTRISVYTGACGALQCYSLSDDIYAGTTAGPNDNYLTNFTFPVEAGVTYYVAFDNRWSANSFQVEVTAYEPTCDINTENWSNPANFDGCWTNINPNEDALTWSFNDVNDVNGDFNPDPVVVIFPPAEGNAAKDEWLISSPRALDAGTEYTFSVTYNGFNAGTTTLADENLELVVLDDLDPTAVVEVIGTVNGITQQGTLADLMQSATTSDFTFTPAAAGTYRLGVHATSDAASGFIFLFELGLQGTLGIQDILATEFSIYPNPATDLINITNADNILVNGVTIVDINGRTVKSLTFDNVTEAQINVADLSTGVYLMNISSDNGTTTKKIVKN